MGIFDCEACSADITAADVFKVVPIMDAPGWLALVYRCKACNIVGRASSSADEWALVQEEYVEVNSEHERLIALFAADLEVFDNVDILRAFWSSLRFPPLIERNMGKCKCPTCMKKIRL